MILPRPAKGITKFPGFGLQAPRTRSPKNWIRIHWPKSPAIYNTGEIQARSSACFYITGRNDYRSSTHRSSRSWADIFFRSLAARAPMRRTNDDSSKVAILLGRAMDSPGNPASLRPLIRTSPYVRVCCALVIITRKYFPVFVLRVSVETTRAGRTLV